MIPNRWPGLNFGLGETADMIRDTVESFSATEIAPRAAEIDRSNEFPRDLWPRLVGVQPILHLGRHSRSYQST